MKSTRIKALAKGVIRRRNTKWEEIKEVAQDCKI